jgi:SnoaL-like domain
MDSIVSDYADDAIFITPEGVLRGKDGVREAFEKLTLEVPGAEWEVPTQIYEDDILLLEWKATSAGSKVEDGIDTFVFRDGLIRVQTVRSTLQRAPPRRQSTQDLRTARWGSDARAGVQRRSPRPRPSPASG